MHNITYMETEYSMHEGNAYICSQEYPKKYTEHNYYKICHCVEILTHLRTSKFCSGLERLCKMRGKETRDVNNNHEGNKETGEV